MLEIGRIRLGDKGPRGEPRKLTTFRLTSFDQNAIKHAAKLFGGKCLPCTSKDLADQFEVITNMCELPIMAPNLPISQYMELWSGGGCQRRCDSETELISGKPCMCTAGAEKCKPTTRVPIVLPDLPGLGVWRLETKGWNAAAELQQSFEFLRALSGQGYTEAVLAIEERTSKEDGKTRKFMVPVIRIPQTIRALMIGERQAALNGDTPALAPSAAALPTHGEFLKGLGLSKNELTEYKQLAGDDWRQIAIEAKEHGIADKSQLFEFAKNKQAVDDYDPFAIDTAAAGNQ
jgi:hypothetical protein